MQSKDILSHYHIDFALIHMLSPRKSSSESGLRHLYAYVIGVAQTTIYLEGLLLLTRLHVSITIADAQGYFSFTVR